MDSFTDQRLEAPWWQQFDPRRSLHLRAGLLFGGTAILFALLLSWIGGAIFRAQIESQIGQSLETLACQVSDKLDRGLCERYRELLLAAGLAPLREPDAPVADRRAMLEALQNASPQYAWIGFADPAGTVRFATAGLFEGTRVDQREWFRRARRLPYAGDVHPFDELAREIGLPAGEPVRFLDLAVPVTSPRGQYLGILGAHLQWSWAREVQDSVIAGPAKSQHLGVTIYAEGGAILLDSGASGWPEPPPAPELPARQLARGHLQENAESGPGYLTGYTRSRGYREFPGLHWLIVVRQPVADAFAPAARWQRWVGGLGGGLALLFVVASGLFASRLTRALRAVTAAAERIRGGDVLSLIPRGAGEDEMARMSNAVADLVDDFRKKQDQLAADNARLAGLAATRPPPAPSPPRQGPERPASDRIRW